MNDLDCAILHEHYHVTDAGMRSVLESLTAGIRQHLPGNVQYLWYSPRKYQHTNGPEEFFSAPAVQLMEDHELGYLDETFGSAVQFADRVNRRKEEKAKILATLFNRHNRIVHLIQNPTLLKNPVETQANAKLAAELLDRDYIQIWHIHDLLEEAAARESLRAHIKSLVGKETQSAFGVNGAGIGWSTSPNIVYAVINSKAHWALQHLLMPQLKQTVFYFPDAIDVAVFEDGCESLRAEVIDDRLERYTLSHPSKAYRFDRRAELLIAAEMARERKNTGEQLLILNMLNAMTQATGRTFQLLVTMLPQRGPDRHRIEVFIDYVRKRRLPVLMGFGPEMISRGAGRESGKFTLADLWRHPRALVEISTAVKEGFGLNFIQPAVATADCPHSLATVGRRLPERFPDFSAAGMLFPQNAYYDTLVIDASIMPNDVLCVDSCKARLPCSDDPSDQPKALSIELDRDFCLYSAQEQVALLDHIDYRKLYRRHRSFVTSILDRDKMNAAAKHNAAAIKRHYSLQSSMHRLNDLIARAFSLKEQRIACGEQPAMLRDNRRLIEFYRDQG